MSEKASVRPAPQSVAVRAREIYAALTGDEEFGALRTAVLRYNSDWPCYSGFVVIQRWNITKDGAQLFEEAVRGTVLKAAVYALTGDEQVAEIALSAPVDDATHAVLAQPQLLKRITDRIGTVIIHQTDQEDLRYTSGDYTHACYLATFGEEPPTRFWIDKKEVDRRLAILTDLNASVGVHDNGLRHELDFTPA